MPPQGVSPRIADATDKGTETLLVSKEPTMLSRISLLLLAGAAATTACAANDPFLGQWKLNPSRSTLTDEMKVTKVGQNRYAFELGGGEPETIVIDGTDQPGYAGSTLSVAAEGSNWKVIRKNGSRIVITATWTLSKDRNLLTDDFTSFGADGAPSSVKYVYKRTAGDGSGFAGTWVSTSEAMNSVFTIRIAPYGDSGLSITSPGGTTNMTFDGQSARRLNTLAMERSQTSNGAVVLTTQYKLSPDLNTLTMITRAAHRTFPTILVFERQ
jgi:hypothetical protein